MRVARGRRLTILMVLTEKRGERGDELLRRLDLRSVGGPVDHM
jgi:hypothetical protein